MNPLLSDAEGVVLDLRRRLTIYVLGTAVACTLLGLGVGTLLGGSLVYEAHSPAQTPPQPCVMETP